MKPVTICLPYYRNHGMLVEWCARLRAMPKDLRSALRLIVVDDGSDILQRGETVLPECAKPATIEDAGVAFELYRIKVNVRWNQDAARNLAVAKAQTEWLLLTDIDHLAPAETLTLLVNGRHDPDTVYRFKRKTWLPNNNLEEYKPHPNSWFMTKAFYDAIGGYDERFAGLYGTDADFKERIWAKLGCEPVMLDQFLFRVPRETIPDASTTTYERKAKEDDVLKDLRRRRNATPGWQTKRLTFPWERVYA
jgi:hypothetical protein